MTIKFEKIVQESKLLNPLNNFQLDTQIIEYRVDPLTKETTFLNVTAVERGIKSPIALDEAWLKDTIEKSKQGCFLCSENIDKSVTRYTSDLVPEGILRIGQVALFPNLFALAKHTAVLTTPSLHYLGIPEHTSSVLNDWLTAGITLIDRVQKTDDIARYAVIGYNYLFPAGSSTVHPHLHVFVDSIPFGYVRKLLDESKRYFEETQRNYWAELVAAEKDRGERYIGAIGDTVWLSPFAPTGDYEVHALIKDKSSFADFTPEDIAALSQGLVKVLDYYHSQKLYSFNMLLYSGPRGDKSGYFWCGLKIAFRTILPPYFTSDITWRQKLMQRYELWFESPERVAAALRVGFK